MRKIVKYEFSDEDRKVLSDLSEAISEVCHDADDDCDYHGQPCPFQTCCAFFSDDACNVLGDVIENLPHLFEKISLDS